MDPDRHAWARLLEGKPAGSYRLERLLGVGGMGAVYGATHPGIGRRVAVKVLAPGYMRDARAIERFHREARLASTVGGRGVVDVLDFQVDPAMGPLLVMEYLFGESVDARIARCGRLDVGEALWIEERLLETLAAIHRHGVIHRDLKPANVFLAATPDGEELVKVVDFGLSRMVEALDAARLTARGATVGTPAFMAPEQAAGLPLDHRTDLYAAAGVLYACLTGRPPHLSWAGYTGPPTSAMAINPEVPEALSGWMGRAMERDPERRFADAEEMREALRALIDVLPAELRDRRARPPNATQETPHAPPVGEAGARSPLPAPAPAPAPQVPAPEVTAPEVPAVERAGSTTITAPGSSPDEREAPAAIPAAIPRAPPPAPAPRAARRPATLAAAAVALVGLAVLAAAALLVAARLARSAQSPVAVSDADAAAASPAPAARTPPAPARDPAAEDLLARVQLARALTVQYQDERARALIEQVVLEADAAPEHSAVRRAGADAILALGDLELRRLTDVLTTASMTELTGRLSAVQTGFARVERFDRDEPAQCGLVGRARGYQLMVGRTDMHPESRQQFLRAADALYERAQGVVVTTPVRGCRTQADQGRLATAALLRDG